MKLKKRFFESNEKYKRRNMLYNSLFLEKSPVITIDTMPMKLLEKHSRRRETDKYKIGAANYQESIFVIPMNENELDDILYRCKPNIFFRDTKRSNTKYISVMKPTAYRLYSLPTKLSLTGKQYLVLGESEKAIDHFLSEIEITYKVIGIIDAVAIEIEKVPEYLRLMDKYRPEFADEIRLYLEVQ